jgi:C_GCAxxG_C_C family probable redox protein
MSISEIALSAKAYKLAFHYEAERGSCPQCVLSAVKETIDIIDTKTIQASDALAGGAALSSHGTCGALAGGLLAISSVVGRTYAEFSEGKRKRRVFKYAQILYDRFLDEYGSPLCCDVQQHLFGQSYSLRDKEEYQAFEAAGAHVDKCPSVAGNVAKWTVEILLKDLNVLEKVTE